MIDVTSCGASDGVVELCAVSVAAVFGTTVGKAAAAEESLAVSTATDGASD